MRRAAFALLYLGTVLTVLGLGKYHAAEIGHYDFTQSSRLSWSIGYIALLCLAAYGAGLPDLGRGRAGVVLALGATFAAATGISLVQLAAGSALLPRFVVFASAVVLVAWYTLCSILASGHADWRAEREQVVAVVTAEEADILRQDLSASPERPGTLAVALVASDARSRGSDDRPLVAAAEQAGASIVVLDRNAQDDESIVAQAAALHEAGVRVRTLTSFYEDWLGKLPVAELERMSLMFDIGELHSSRYGRVKRLLDVVVGGAGMLALVVLTPLVALGNLVANRGSLFYRQPRVGKGGELFDILKFRTMREMDGGGAEWTTEGDRRITPFGRLLRKAHVDELPQVWNILRGDLSTVGPRPEQPQYVEELTEKIPFYDLRHLVRPGLTGWAQVNYAYGSSEFDALEKLQFEFYYLRHQGLALDLRIIGRTIRSVVRLGGR